jgi:uncharacterized protein
MRAIRHMHATEDEATRAAEATLQRAAMSAMGLSAQLARFAPGMLAGATVQVAGLRAELAGEWQISRVTHRFDNSGLMTSFEGRKGAP